MGRPRKRVVEELRLQEDREIDVMAREDEAVPGREDPAISGLLEKLPPVTGLGWPEEALAEWLDVFGRTVRLVYKPNKPAAPPA